MNTYEIIENGCEFTTIEADSAEGALEKVDPPLASDYSACATCWVEWHARNTINGFDFGSKTFTVDPEEPDCEAGHKHDWQDHDPVSGHGGGVVYSERCRHCGTVRYTDTWAQNPGNGVQGLHSIRYGRDDET